MFVCYEGRVGSTGPGCITRQKDRVLRLFNTDAADEEQRSLCVQRGAWVQRGMGL